MKRAAFVLLSVCLGLGVACGRTRTPEKFRQKLVVLGFGGMDPTLVRKWMGEGKLPNLQKLARQGGLHALETSPSPESLSAWASFATGMNAGKHNIYSALARDAATYRPQSGIVREEPPRFLLDYVPIAAAKPASLRGGTSFWVHAGNAGVRSSILTVPVTFPPETVPNGELLSGFPLPDIRGTIGTFSYFATDVRPSDEGPSESGGIVKRLFFTDDTARTELIGPPNPIVGQQLRKARAAQPQGDDERARIAELSAREHLRLPIAVHWNRPGRSATITIGDNSVHLQEGEWSKWIDLEFDANLLVRTRGMAQLFLIAAGPQLQLYISPVNWRSGAPPAPMSSPASLAGDLLERLGPYRTLGWAEATSPLNEERLDEKAFMDDLFRAFDDRAQVILQRLDTRQWDLLVGVIESTDRVQHMMWRLIDPAHPLYDRGLAARYGDSIERVYRKCDEFVGEVMSRIDVTTPVLVVSEHGFHSFRQSVDVNRWLIQQGFMTLLGNPPAGGAFWAQVDWPATRAYAMGSGQIYVNLKGREGHGIIAAGAESTKLQDELAAALLTMADPATGQKIVSAVYKRDDLYAGPFRDNAAELQVGFAEGYRPSEPAAPGGEAPGIVSPNKRKWSGDHAGYDYKATAGMMISSRPLSSDAPKIVDLAPTVLKYFGLPIPGEIDGTPLF